MMKCSIIYKIQHYFISGFVVLFFFLHKVFKNILTHPFKFWRDLCFFFLFLFIYSLQRQFKFIIVIIYLFNFFYIFIFLPNLHQPLEKGTKRKILKRMKSHQIICGITNGIFFFSPHAGGFGLVFKFVN